MQENRPSQAGSLSFGGVGAPSALKRFPSFFMRQGAPETDFGLASVSGGFAHKDPIFGYCILGEKRQAGAFEARSGRPGPMTAIKTRHPNGCRKRMIWVLRLPEPGRGMVSAKGWFLRCLCRRNAGGWCPRPPSHPDRPCSGYGDPPGRSRYPACRRW